MRTPEEVCTAVRTLRQDCTERDSTMADIHTVRKGRIQDVFPSMFNEYFDAPVVQNFIDTAARDVAESLAPLPAVNCAAPNMSSDAARKRADVRSKGANFYLEVSETQRVMYTASDYYATYGFLPVVVEPDFDGKHPRLYFENPRGSYYELDRNGRCVTYTRLYLKTVRQLCVLYPDIAHRIVGEDRDYNSHAKLELLYYRDDDQLMMFLPERHDLVLERSRNPLGKCPVVIAERPGVTRIPRGQYDDVMWIQVARNRFAMMAMQAAEQAVEAPLAVPPDVQDFSVGGMQVIRSNSPEKIRKVMQELPQAAFAEGQLLDEEMKAGARYPGVRTGNLDASIITGQGVKALEGGYDSQIRAAQQVFEVMFKKVIALCFEMDEKYWPDSERSITGQKDGVPYDIKWKPERDVNGDYSVHVEYGFAAGLDPNRSVVMLLQAQGGGLISRDTVRRQLPFAVNVMEEEQRIEVETMRDSLMAAMAGYAASVPALAAQGMNVEEALQRIATVIDQRMKGKPLETVVADAFRPEAPPPGAEGAPGAAGADPLAALMGGGGAPMGGPADPAALGGGGGQPMSLINLLAGINSGGQASMSSSVQRKVPV